MSSVVVITPLVIAGWPVISAAVTAAVASMGFSVVRAAAAPTAVGVAVKAEGRNKVDIELDESEILASSVSNEQIVVERDGIRATFSRDERGALKLCMEGESHSKADLKRIGEDLVNRVTQQFVYHRVVSELKQRNMTIVDEQVGADRTVKIRVRNL
jgi:hypothetical protein